MNNLEINRMASELASAVGHLTNTQGNNVNALEAIQSLAEGAVQLHSEAELLETMRRIASIAELQLDNQ